MGGWSTRHARLASLLWIGFVVVCVVGGTIVSQQGLTDSQSADGQTARAEQIIDSARFPQSASESILIESRSATISGPSPGTGGVR